MLNTDQNYNHPSFTSTYTSRLVDPNGFVAYTEDEDDCWYKLITQQEPLVRLFACEEYLDGLHLLNFPKKRVPQCYEISAILNNKTGWSLEPVPALIPDDLFFRLLSKRKFPAATFVRRQEDFEYVPEPDIFHEMFGHCPLLTNSSYADFAAAYGQLSMKASPEEQAILARLYWFTLEVGIINTAQGLRAYGGSILSSANEIIYALESGIPQLKPFDILEVMRTPYRIDILQPVYFVIDDFNTLYQLMNIDLFYFVHKAQELNGNFKCISNL